MLWSGQQQHLWAGGDAEDQESCESRYTSLLIFVYFLKIAAVLWCRFGNFVAFQEYQILESKPPLSQMINTCRIQYQQS